MKSRIELTYAEKKELAGKLKSEKHENQRFLSKKYKISVGLVNKLLKMDFDKGVPKNHSNMKRLSKLRKTQDLEPVLCTWFNESRSRNISITKDSLVETALYIAKKLNVCDFKASNGWLESFLKRNSIKSKRINGEAGLVDFTILHDFSDVLKQKLSEYEDRDVYNCDETGLMFKQSSKRTYTLSDADKANGMFSKERITVLFAVSKTGEKLTPLIIGKSKNPRCFKNLKVENLPCSYFSQFKSWMNSEIFINWIKKFDDTMSKENRKILLLLDNAPIHPRDVDLTNVELLFFPANTTSRIQPLDQGIIKAFKDSYRKILLSEVKIKLEKNVDLNFEQCLKKITMLDAVLWTGRAWSIISSETVINCFREAIKNCYNPIREKVKEPRESSLTNEPFEKEVEELPTHQRFPDNDKDMIDAIIVSIAEEKSSTQNNEECEPIKCEVEFDYTFLDAYTAVEKLEKYFLQHQSDDITLLWKIKDNLEKSRTSRPPLITDWLVHKKME